MKLKLTPDQDATLDVGGKGKVPKRAALPIAAKAKTYKLKTKTGIALQAGVQKKIGLKFAKNTKTVKQIIKLLKGSKKARKRSKVLIELTAITNAGVTSDSTVKIKLKP